MSTYRAPEFLDERYPEFDQRYDLREQFQRIVFRMESNQKKLESLLEKTNAYKIQTLLEEMKRFRVWSWKEADMDDFFYDTIKDFDKRAFVLINTKEF